MNDWAISKVLNEIYDLQRALAALRDELEREQRAQQEIRESSSRK